MVPIEFEKDDDSNHHIDFISAVSNLRARQYAIPELDRLKIKAIAGRIMPAIATTTAAVSGLVAIELIKVVQNLPLDKYKNLFMNLALPFWALTEPGEAPKTKIGNSTATYTLWDKWELKGDRLLSDFVAHFKKTYNLQVSGVFNGPIIVYMESFPTHKKRLAEKMSVLLKKKDQPYFDLIITFSNEGSEQEVSGPPVRFIF